jgi:hypothetical protein
MGEAEKRTPRICSFYILECTNRSPLTHKLVARERLQQIPPETSKLPAWTFRNSRIISWDNHYIANKSSDICLVSED